jgi:hypothetical protein
MPDDKHGEFETIAQTANNQIRELDPIKSAKADIDARMTSIAGAELAQKTELTVLNADGINFNAFIPLFGRGRLSLSVAILTDGDDADRTGTPSATATGLKAKEAETPNLRVKFGEITFEHELARSAALLPFMLTAFRTLHPALGAELDTEICFRIRILLEHLIHLSSAS